MKIRVALLLLALAGSGPAAAQQLQFVNPPGLSTPRSYTHVVRAGSLVFVAGQVAIDDTGRVVGSTMAEQLERALSNLEVALKSQGADWSHVAKTTVYTTSVAEFVAEDAAAVRAKHLGTHKPANTLVQVQQLANPQFKVEIEAIAVLPGGR